MRVRNVGRIIKQARLDLKMTQEELSEGICDVTTLAKIENGNYGVSVRLFNDLSSKLNIDEDLFPSFVNKDDYECFQILRKTSYYINSLQLEKAKECLNDAEKINWGNSDLNYQTGLFLYIRILHLSANTNYRQILDVLKYSLTFSNCPQNIDSQRVYSIIEVRIYAEIAFQLNYLQDYDACMDMTNAIDTILNNYKYDSYDMGIMISENNISKICCLIMKKKYAEALTEICATRTSAKKNLLDAIMIELSMLESVCNYCLKRTDKYEETFFTAFYAARAININYSEIVTKYIKRYQINIPNGLIDDKIKENDCISIPKKNIYSQLVKDNEKNYHIGKIIKEKRMELGISQEMLAKGLCTKSYLSKIENNFSKTDIFMIEALCERLGIDSEDFIFLSGQYDEKINDIRKKLINLYQDNRVVEQNQIELYKDLIKDNKILKEQMNLYSDLMMSGFEFNIDYKLVNKIIDSIQVPGNTIKNIDMRVIINYIDMLGKNENYDEIIRLSYLLNPEAFFSRLNLLGEYFYNVSVAYDKKMLKTQAYTFAKEAYYTLLLYGNEDAAEKIRPMLEERLIG